jgi:hypothetical protein
MIWFIASKQSYSSDCFSPNTCLFSPPIGLIIADEGEWSVAEPSTVLSKY